jgi:hypothetical protein
MRRITKLLTSAFGALFMIIPAAAVLSQQSDADIVASFKKHLTDYVASYKTNRRDEIRETSGGWCRNYYDIDENYSVDLRKTDSLISPYVGTANFAFIMHSTSFHKTKAEAEADNNFIRSQPLKHRHSYAYQDGAWVLTQREEYNVLLDVWWKCDKDDPCIAEGAL